jgi:hypothetical protein
MNMPPPHQGKVTFRPLAVKSPGGEGVRAVMQVSPAYLGKLRSGKSRVGETCFTHGKKQERRSYYWYTTTTKDIFTRGMPQ